MDLRQLRYFVAVADELHFGRAAERLGISQPPLSQSIQRLEEELGARLFARTHRHVELTPVGAAWLPDVVRVLAMADRLPGLVQQLVRGEAGTLTLAFISTADYSVLPDLLGAFTAQYPEVVVNLREATTDLQLDWLLSETIDAGIVILPDDLHPSLIAFPLLRERLMVALPERWIIEGRVGSGAVSLAELADAPLIHFPRQIAPVLHDLITGVYGVAGIEILYGQQAIQMQTIVSLVSAGLGVALVPESLRTLQRSGVVYRELAGVPAFLETGLVWRRRDVAPVVQRFVELVKGFRPG